MRRFGFVFGKKSNDCCDGSVPGSLASGLLNMLTVMRLLAIGVLSLSLLCPSVLLAGAAPHRSSRFKEVAVTEPSFTELMQGVFDYHGIEQGIGDDWKKKLKVAPWLPDFYLGYDHVLRETTSLAIKDNISVTGTAVNVGPLDNDWGYSANRGGTLRFRAVWRLQELVFNPAQFNRSRELRDLVKTRLSLTDYIFKIYTARHELLRRYGVSQNRRIKLQIEFLTEQLDALTDNRFSGRWVP